MHCSALTSPGLTAQGSAHWRVSSVKHESGPEVATETREHQWYPLPCRVPGSFPYTLPRTTPSPSTQPLSLANSHSVTHSQPNRPTVALRPTGNGTQPRPTGRTHLLQLVILFHVLLGRLASTLRLLFKGFVGRQQRGLLGDESHQASKQATMEKEGKLSSRKQGKWLAGTSLDCSCLNPASSLDLSS